MEKQHSLGVRGAARLVLAASVLALGACGDEDPFANAPSEPTKARFIAEADEICRTAEQEVRRESARALEGIGDRSLTDDELGRIADEVVIPIAEDQLAQLEELPRPAEDRELLEKIFSIANRELDRLRGDPASIEDPETVFADASDLAERYGFQDCADTG